LSESAHPSPAPRPRNHSIEARREARALKAARERLIVDCLNRGLSMAEIAQRTGVTEKRMRAAIREILARREPQAPDEFVAMQVGRLNEALNVAYSAMSRENLGAVRLVVRIVRELDRYHGFAPSARRAARGGAQPAGGLAPSANIEPALQASEKTRSAPGNGAKARARRPAVPNAGPDPATGADASAGPPTCAMPAPQTIEKARFAPGNGSAPAAPDEAAGPGTPRVAGEAPAPSETHAVDTAPEPPIPSRPAQAAEMSQFAPEKDAPAAGPTPARSGADPAPSTPGAAAADDADENPALPFPPASVDGPLGIATDSFVPMPGRVRTTRNGVVPGL